jgi:ubiquinone/menaquinone biosynthesis C-methylase UbiE
LSKQEIENLPYFDMIAYLGASSIHPDGFKATKDMIKLANIRDCRQILDIGCGTGYTACYLAKKNGCKVTGVDISKEMIERAMERARKNKVEINFKVADAHKLPFENNSFNAVIGESITIYLDKVRALNEYVRVTKPRGVIVDMEFTWLKEPSEEVIRDTCKLLDTDAEILSSEEWKKLFINSGLRDVEAYMYPMRMNLLYMLRKILDQRFESFRVLYRVLRNPNIKKKMGDIKRHFKKYSDYFGYGIYVGRK